jgi:uncharacterized membrane protein YdbT with pleckstrin-like domain
VEDIEIRPTIKFVRAGAVFVDSIVLAAWGAFAFGVIQIIWIPAILSAAILWPLAIWLGIRSTVTVLTSDRIRSESGVLSRSTRNLMLSRVQDVGLFQSFSNRMFNVGDVWIETAGASSRVVLHSIDSPREVADIILERARIVSTSIN